MVEDSLRRLLGLAAATLMTTLLTWLEGTSSANHLHPPEVGSLPCKKSHPPCTVIHPVADIPEVLRVQHQVLCASTEDCDDPEWWTQAHVIQEYTHPVTTEKTLTLR
jgi:hypothetical protein